MNSEVIKRDLFERVIDGVKVFDIWEQNILDIDYTSQTYNTKRVGLKVCIDRNERFKPILFSNSCLTKPIQISSYNNGEPFVPIVEMAKLNGFKGVNYKLIDENGTVAYLEESKKHPFSKVTTINFLDFNLESLFSTGVMNYLSEDAKSTSYLFVKNQLKMIDLFHKFHINYRLSPDQFIEVTDSFNPYK